MSDIKITISAKDRVSAAPSIAPFPSKGVLPKEETQAAQFLEKYPEYDGRGVSVAILDTGVDPAAIGLQKTTTGARKITHLIDCTGDGDISMAKSFNLSKENREIELISGRKFTVPDHWIVGNQEIQFRVGSKNVFDLFPKKLLDRVLKDRRKGFWDPLEQDLSSDLLRKSESVKLAEEKEDFVERISQLKKMQESLEDSVLIYDFILFKQNDQWRIAMIEFDPVEDIVDISKVKLFKPYGCYLDNKDDGLLEWSFFSDIDLFSYSFNVFEDGEILSLVTNCGSHGTHVAGIVAANLENFQMNGVAPGAQIVSLKVGDSRLGSMETGTSLIRALSEARRLGCDVINLSYGEAASGEGKITAVAEEVVKRGSIFVSSAGNEGPALSTVGAPGGVGSIKSAISVGAFVTDKMMLAEYCMRETIPSTQFTWSSRGPSWDGGLGVSISAPGGAIAPVPSWTLQKNQLMNGTSMSSPNAAGSIALILSGLKAEGISYSPYSIRRSLEATAYKHPGSDSWSIGHGLIQVSNAYQHAKDFAGLDEECAAFEVSVPSISPNAHGIYLREPQEIDKDFECTVFVDPIFPDTLESINEKKFQFEMKCSLSCDQDWVSHAKHVLLMHGGRGFDVKVDPKELAPGVHYAEIIGFDSKAPAKGPLFRVPITVIKPDKKSEDSSRYMYSKIDFSPGGIHRKFFIAPTGSQIAKITVRSIGKQATSRTYMLHCVYNELEAAHTKSSLQKHFVMNDGDEQVFCAPVRENTMVEITLAQFWKSLGTSSLSLDVEFHGVQVNPGAINLDGANIISRIDIHSLLNKEKVNLSASIKTLEYQISPNDDETRILPLSSPRDVLPNGKLVYQLLLNYSLELGEKETLTIRAPVLCDLLYESNYESQMWLVYDSRKKLVSKGDFRPKPITLPQGSYTIKYQVKHEDIKALERLKNMNIVARRNLTKKVGLSCFKTYQSALENSNVVSKFDIGSGQRKAVFIRLPEDFSVIYKALPKKVGKGKAYKFTGELTVLSLNGTGSSKVEIPIFVNDIFYPKSDSKDKKSVKKTESFDVSKEHNYALVKWLSGLKPEEFNQAFEVYGKSLVDNDSKNVSVILIQLKNAVSEAKACSSPDAKLELLHKVVDLSDKIFNSLDLQDLASHLGKKVQEDAESVAKNEEIQKSKESLQEALLRKSLAMLEIRKISLTQVDFSMDTWESDWKAHLSMLKSWVDLEKETKFQIVHIQSLLLSGKLGLALKYVSKAISEGECGDQLELWELRQQILSSLGPHWSHWANHFKTLKLSSFPGDYQPF